MEQHGNGGYHPNRPSDDANLNIIVEIKHLTNELGKLENELTMCIKKGYPVSRVKSQIRSVKHQISILDGKKVVKLELTVRPDYDYGSFACWPPKKRRIIKERIKEVDKLLQTKLKDTEKNRLETEKNRILESEKEVVLKRWR